MQLLIRRSSAYPFFIILYPVFFVFHGFVENFYFVSVDSALLLTGIYCISFSVLSFIFYLLLKRVIPAALIAGFLMTLHFFFGFLLDFVINHFPNTILAKYSFLISFFFILTILLFLALKRKKDLSAINKYLNILFAVLILVDIASLIREITISKKENRDRQINNSYVVCGNCIKPDIYIILLDEYAGRQELENDFNYDNKPFFDSLALRGFKTIPYSHSNYNYTPYSTASTLNMEYLDSAQANNVRRTGNKYAETKINNSEVISFFLANRYKFFNASIFKVHGQAAPTAGSFVPANTKLITGNTFITRFSKDVLLNMAERFKMKKYLSKMLNAANQDNKDLIELTEKIAGEKSKQPKIVYTHLLMPHHPYYYDENGNFHQFESVSALNLGDTAAYLSYLKYTNKTVLHLVDQILSTSVLPPLIVLLSDHGFRHIQTKIKEDVFSNLISLHLPSKGYNHYPDTISNVNLFRLLLNNEFNQRLPLLKDQQFFIAF